MTFSISVPIWYGQANNKNIRDIQMRPGDEVKIIPTMKWKIQARK